MKNVLKRSLSILLAITIIFSSAYVGLGELDFSGLFAIKAQAASSGSCGDNLTWTLDYEGTLSISGTGNMDNYSYSSLAPWESMKESIRVVEIDSGVASIGNMAFNECTNLTSVKFPGSVTKMGSSSFNGCTNLEGVYITDLAAWCNISYSSWSSNPLYYAEKLYVNGVLATDIIIPDGVTKISNYAFYYCRSLTSITLPDGIKSIGEMAFEECTSLVSITIPSGLEEIYSYAFMNCTKLANVYVPDDASWCNIKFKNRYANPLYYAKKLYINETLATDIVIPNGITSIGDYTFCYCNIKSVDIPVSVKTIGYGAFTGCTSLSDVYYSGNETDWAAVSIKSENESLSRAKKHYIDDVLLFSLRADGNSYEVTGYKDTERYSINIPSTYNGLPVTEIGACAFQESYFTSITIPDSVTSIGYCAFVACMLLKTVTLPSGLKSISDSLFAECWSLENVKIPEGVTGIGSYAFQNCTSLKSLTIPDTVTYLGNCPFAGSAIETLDFYARLEYFDPTIFAATTYLLSINVDADNPYYISVDGVLFDKSMKTLLAYPKAKTTNLYVIPNGVKTIRDGAFAETSINAVVIPKSVTKIDTEMGIGQFEYTTLTDVFYLGTQTEWNEISVGPYSLNDASIHYNCTQTSSGSCPIGVLKSFTCSECSKSVTQQIAATEHKYSDDWAIDVEPTCTEPGSKSHHCTICGDKKDFTIIGETGHSYSDWSVTKDADCDEDGSKSKTCLNCNDVLTETISATGHKYSTEWTIDVAPTCTANGSKSHHCAICDDRTDVTVIASTGHSYEITDALPKHPHTVQYKCTSCEATKSEKTVVLGCIECNFTITAIDANSYKLVSFIGTETDIVIPATYNGRAVTTVGNSCFKGNTAITSVEIAEGVTSIGSLTFMNCASLEKVVIPSSVTSIGSQAFYGFTGTIYCTNGSVAHNYAVANNIKYILLSIKGTESTKIDYENLVIRTSVQNCADITGILDVSKTAIAIPTASYTHGNLEFYGTGTIVTIFDGDLYIGDFTLIVEGDTNGDSVCDVLDCFDIERASNGNAELSGAYAMAADSNSDDAVDITDYQAIVNKSVL